jgi:hypothetical protein
MIINVRVQVERPDEYVGKKGLVKQHIITCQDVDPSGMRLVNTFDYTLTEEEKTKYAGKLLDRELKIGITELMPFGGRLRARGKVMEVPSLDQKAPK